jgi:simple sugar transport system permease protein
VELAAVTGISREMIGVVSALVIGFVAVQPAVRRLLTRAARTRRSRCKT